MNSNVPLDNAYFQLSPKRTRCELFVSADGKTEKLASGFFKPFVTHLTVAEKQFTDAVHMINLEVGRSKNAATWFNKGTVERFVRFVSTPEVLELLSTLDAEMSQLEGARKMYSQGARHQFSGGSEAKSAASADATEKELVRAIDVRISAVRQNLAAACARASAAGFNLESVSDLLLFADQFGAFRLSEACKNFHSLSQRRPELSSYEHSLPSPDIHSQWKNFEYSNVRSSSGSDMSIDEPLVVQTDPVRLTATSCSDSQLHNFRTRQQQQQSVDKPSTSATGQLNPDSQHFVEKDMEKVEDEPDLSVASSSKPALQAGVSRQLSVQDRINLFESKKKEQSGSPIVIGGNSGAITASRLAGAKGEHHRRNHSDLSSEKLVLRRWSGASDMSIDPNSNCSSSSIDRKENESTAGTPTSSANSQFLINSRNSENEGNGLKEASNYPGSSSQNSLVSNSSSTFSSSQDQQRSFPQGDIQARDAIYKEGIASNSIESPGLSKEKMQANTWQNMGGSFTNSGGSVVSREPGFSQTNSRTSPEDLVNDEMLSEVPSRAPLALEVPSEQNDQASLLAQIGTFTSKMEGAGARSKYASDSQIHFRAPMEKMAAIFANGDSVNPEANRDFEEQEETEQKNLTVPKLPSKSFSTKARQGIVSQGLEFPVNASGTDHRKKSQGRRDGILSVDGSNASPLQSRKINEGMESPPLSLEESQTSRPNADTVLSDVLQLKGEEMEKLFGKHKLKNHGDPIASARRMKTLGDHETKNVEKRPAQSPKQKPEKTLLQQGSINGIENEFDSSFEVESSDLSDTKQKIGNHTPSDFLRGELYEKYMSKRDAKLNQECSSNRAQKEAKMKEMLDMLEHSQEEMKARFTRFSDGQKFRDAHLRAEKMKSFNMNTTIKVKEQISESLTGDEDDVDLELSEPSTGSRFKKISSNKPLTSTSVTSVGPKYLVKSAYSGSIRHKGQTENPVAQSIPSFSNYKNENIKSSVVVTKATTRGQTKNFTRSKSFIDDTEISMEDRSLWSNSMRKSSVTTELKNLSSPNSEKTFHKAQIGGELRQYLKKGNSVNHGSGIIPGKSRILETPEEVKNNERSEEIASQNEDSPEMVVENLERACIDGNNLDLRIGSDVEKPRDSQESCGPESEKDDLMRPLSQQDDSNIFFSKFNSARDTEDSPEESFVSLNSHVYHSHAYRREASDIYDALDSPSDSSSWNSHSLSHIVDSEATRMRKKWGSAQVPVIAASVSQQSRRDVTKGFKRLLKFGRKNRGADYLVNDWVSASTASEGDDDPEDGGDLVHRPSDDFRKSRMGYNVTSYDGFNDIGIFSEQAQSLRNSIPNPTSNFRVRDDHLSGSSLKAPRSFFSLSSFRSKAGR